MWRKIPGETPIDDVSGLIPKGIRTRARLNLHEAENIRKAVVLYLASRPTRRLAPFTLRWCYRLHQQMLGETWQWAGKRRSTELNLGSPVHRIDMDLQGLLDDLAFWRERDSIPPIEQAARLHHRAVQIHPFINGNGRWARLLAMIHQKQQDNRMTMWPEATVARKSVIRDEYLRAIRAADRGDYTLLISMHEHYTRPL